MGSYVIYCELSWNVKAVPSKNISIYWTNLIATLSYIIFKKKGLFSEIVLKNVPGLKYGFFLSLTFFMLPN